MGPVLRYGPCLLLALAGAGCVTPPAIFEAGADRILLSAYPPGTEEVSVEVEPGVSLRGVFVPSDPGAPVVVHFPGSGTSVSIGGTGIPELAWELRDRGLASLALDYRGVGPSGGDRSPWNLRGDARAALAEAARRAGGEGRVVLRGMSLGTLAAAAPLEEGRRPAAAVLVSPVRAETVADRFVYENYADFLAFLAVPFLRDAGDVDLVKALRACPCPLLVLSGSKDALLPPPDAALVRSATLEAGGTFAAREGTGHLPVYLEGLEVFPEEAALLARVFPGRPDRGPRLAAALAALPPGEAAAFAPGTAARARLEAGVARRLWRPAALSAALALGDRNFEGEAARQRLAWLRSLRWYRLEALPFEALRSLVSLEDPDGPLDPREFVEMRGFVDQWTAGGRVPVTSEELVRRARGGRLARRACWAEPLPEAFRTLGILGVATESHDLDAPEGTLPGAAPARLRLPPEASFRQAVRLLLKAAGIPDRVTITPEGEVRLEVFGPDGWRALRL